MVVYNNILAGASGVTGAADDYEISRSLRFNSGDSAHLSRTPSSAGNRKTFTFSAWIKLSDIGTGKQTIFSAGNNSSFGQCLLEYDGSYNQFWFRSSVVNGTMSAAAYTTALFRDPGAWYHLVMSVDTTQATASDRVKMYVNGVSQSFVTYSVPQDGVCAINTATEHRIGRSVSTNSDYLNSYLADVHFIDGQALDATDFGEYDDNNVWQPKEYSGTYGTNGFSLNFKDTTSNQALGYDASVESPAVNNKGGFDAVTYIGTGIDQTIKGLAFQPDLVWIKTRDDVENHFIVDSVRGVTNQLYANTNGTEFTNANRFKAFNPNGFTVGTTDDTNQSGYSFVAWAWKAGGSAVTNTDGSITSQVSASSEYGFSVVSYTGTGSSGTIGHGLNAPPKLVIVKERDTPSSGTSGWMTYHNGVGDANKYLRLESADAAATASSVFGADPTSSVFSIGGDREVSDNTKAFIAYCWSEVSGYSKFGSFTHSGSASSVTGLGFKPRFVLIKRTSATDSWYIFDSARDTDNALFPNTTAAESSGWAITFNDDGFSWPGGSFNSGDHIYAAFGDRAGNNFTTNNLIASAGFETASQGMDVVTYTGNGSTQSITGLNFQPDFVWLKGRSQSNVSHQLYDVVRGTSKMLQSDNNTAEGTVSGVTSFDSNGFTIGSNGGSNNNTSTYVAWAWKAGGAAVSNTDGTQSTSVSANSTYGFSVVTYSGTSNEDTFGHGLGAVPRMVFFKARNAATNWQVYHDDGTNKRIFEGLNTTSTGSTNITSFKANPTSSVLSLEDGGYSLNSNGTNMVAYCWSEIPGFSRFGSYTGNGSSTGPVVTTGFKPKFLMIKRTDSAENWNIRDSVRDTTNPANKILYPNTSSQENAATTNQTNLLSDGFEIVSTNTDYNASGGTYIYAAFADKPPGEIIDSLIDTPTDITADSGNNPGNYATLNPLNTNTNQTLSDGNLKCAATGNQWGVAPATIAITSGKYYFESTVTGNNYHYIGIANKDSTILDSVTSTDDYWGKTSNDWGYQSGGTIIHNGGHLAWGTQTSYGTGDVVALAFDADTKTTKWYKNGTQIHTGTISGSAPFFVGVGSYGSGSFSEVNFGQRPFAYTPPANHLPLVTTNLSDPTIADGSTAFDTKLWTGNGTARSITMDNSSMSPDFVWIKARNNTSWHYLYNSVTGAGKELFSNATNAENTSSTTLTSFDSNGFSLGSDGGVNQNTKTFVGWAWDAGSSTVSNTDGTITSNVRANPSAGFSICTYTGSTGNQSFGHGLNAAPKFIVIKNRSNAANWFAMVDIGTTYLKYGHLNTTDALADATAQSVSSSTVTLGNNNAWFGANGDNYVAYCFAPVEGYSSIGSYQGNGSADGPFVYTGFRPKWLLIKKYDSGANNWYILDTERDTFNAAVNDLYADIANVENSFTGATFDILSNGFKVRTTEGSLNSSGSSILYAAFAEHPLKYSRAR